MRKARIWLEFAERDLERAKVMYSLGDYDDAAYHLQQAVEKSLKSVMVYFGITPNVPKFKIHNIENLISVLEEGGINVPDWMYDAVLLTRYAFTTRYPDDYVPVSEEEYMEAYDIALKVYEWARGVVQN